MLAPLRKEAPRFVGPRRSLVTCFVSLGRSEVRQSHHQQTRAHRDCAWGSAWIVLPAASASTSITAVAKQFGPPERSRGVPPWTIYSRRSRRTAGNTQMVLLRVLRERKFPARRDKSPTEHRRACLRRRTAISGQQRTTEDFAVTYVID